MATATAETTKTAAEIYLELMDSRPIDTVDVKLPSGAVFKLKKPSVIGLIFDERAGLPQTATTEAAAKWTEDGVLSEPDEDEEAETDEPAKSAAQVAFDRVDRVCEMSVEPKITLQQTANKNELWYRLLSADDLSYLYKWVASGGNVSLMLTMFPERPETDALASASRKKQRGAGK